MLRTVGSEAKWRSVPAGFRVDWGKVDLRTFEDPSWFTRKWRATLAVFTTIDLVVSSVWWSLVDTVNAVRCGGKDIFAATRRVIRVRAAPIKPRWNLSVNITVNRHAQMAAANDLGFVRGHRLAA